MPKKNSTEPPLDEPAFRQEVPDVLDHPGHWIRRLHQISVAVFTAHAKEYGLTSVQYATLSVVEHCPGMDQRSVGRAVALDRQTVSNVVQRLAEKGLLDRQAKDLRSNALYLTGAGRAVLEVMRARLSAVDELLLQPLTAAEQQTFLGLVQKLVVANNHLARAPGATP